MGNKAILCGHDIKCANLAKYRCRFKSQDWSESPLVTIRLCEQHKDDYSQLKKLHGNDIGPLEIIGEREMKILQDYDRYRENQPKSFRF